ncbi:MAG TPA: cytochrome D1 domain-containing protein [Bryobacteraceae bacterium]|jgi:YVTN family beta-propeller protein|nr:cytochrome D1 domain-containing protein [Bryobacteraceae bacterium]
MTGKYLLVGALGVVLPVFGAMKARVVQTNSAGDNVHVIDPATNKVVGTIEGIEVPHGTVLSPDGTRIYVTEEAAKTVDAVDSKTLKVIKKVPLSGRPNNLAVTKDGKKIYVGIAQQPGAVDVIDATTLTNVKSIPVQGAIHNVFTTPDSKYAVSGSVATGVITAIDTATDTVAWSFKETSGIRPMIFTTNPDGSTKEMIYQLSNFHGFVIADFVTHKEIRRVEQPDVPGQDREIDGIQGAPAHGLVMTKDGKTLWTTSKYYDYVAAYSFPDLKLLKVVQVGSHPEWLTIPPDGKNMYVGCAGTDTTDVIDVKTMKVIARIPVGAVPKRNTSGMIQTN